MGAAIEVPYLVVGAGPVGLTAAQLLAHRGRECLVVERRDGPLRHPAAHVINARSLEIFRQAGFDMEAILEVASAPDDAGHVNFVSRLAGELIGRLPFERQGPEVFDLTPTPLRNISQHRLEPIQADAIASSPTAQLRYRTEWVSSVQDADGVTSIVTDLDTGDEIEVRSRYVLGADGAGSRVRKSLGIEMIGPPSIQSLIAIHVAADLRSFVADRLGVLHFVMDPETSGTFVAHDLDREWVFMTSYDPETESVADYDVSRAAAIVRRAIGRDDVDLEVLDVGSWHMSAQVAERTRERRIFLVGDAAHRFPPTGGLGLNTGVADVHGLIWKLLAVDDGWAHESLLGTHDVERLPVARTNCEQSLTNVLKLIVLFEALRLSPGATSDDLRATLADEAARPAIDAAVEEQATHFDMIGLQLGYCYAEGALARSGDAPGPITDPRIFEPDGQVGTRLPHGWLDDGRSTLDLIDDDVLTLITSGDPDRRDAATAGQPAPIRRIGIGVDAPADPAWTDLCGLRGDAAILVRPDQHIAWRSDGGIPLSDALDAITGRASPDQPK